MQTIFISYADQRFQRRQRMAAYSAIVNGGVDRCIQYGPEDLEPDFVRRNQFLLSRQKGAGFWVWKPHIILDAMTRVDAGDVIIYCDSGSLITGSLAPLVETCQTLTDGVLGFDVEDGFIERQWTKRDAFVLTGCDRSQYWDTPQLRGGTIVFVNCEASRQFVCDWMNLVRQVRLVSDMPSLCEHPEFDDFQSHRHDQSLFSLLYKKRGYASYKSLTGRHLSAVLRSHILSEPSILKLLPSYLHPSLYRRGPGNRRHDKIT